MAGAAGDGTRERPWVLKTPSGQSEFEAFRDEEADPPALVVQVGKSELRYHPRSTTCTPCSGRTVTGCRSGAPTSNPRPKDLEASARSPDNLVGWCTG